jgi:hypothetical protein
LSKSYGHFGRAIAKNHLKQCVLSFPDTDLAVGIPLEIIGITGF